MVNTLHEQLLAIVSDDTDGISPALDTALGALRAVVELHAPVQADLWGRGVYWRVCSGCIPPAEPPDWIDCSTIKAVASALGVELPDA